MILYVSFYELVDDGIGVGMLYYVRPAVQIVTITLPIHYCIPYTTYATTNYNVNSKQQKSKNIRNSLK